MRERSAPVRSALERLTRERIELERLVCISFVLERSMPERDTWERSAPVRSALERFESIKLIENKL